MKLEKLDERNFKLLLPVSFLEGLKSRVFPTRKKLDKMYEGHVNEILAEVLSVDLLDLYLEQIEVFPDTNFVLIHTYFYQDGSNEYVKYWKYSCGIIHDDEDIRYICHAMATEKIK